MRSVLEPWVCYRNQVGLGVHPHGSLVGSRLQVRNEYKSMNWIGLRREKKREKFIVFHAVDYLQYSFFFVRCTQSSSTHCI